MGPSPHGVDGSPVVKGLGAPDLCFLSLRHALGCPHTEQQRSSLKPQNTGNRRFRGANGDAPLP